MHTTSTTSPPVLHTPFIKSSRPHLPLVVLMLQNPVALVAGHWSSPATPEHHHAATSAPPSRRRVAQVNPALPHLVRHALHPSVVLTPSPPQHLGHRRARVTSSTAATLRVVTVPWVDTPAGPGHTHEVVGQKRPGTVPQGFHFFRISFLSKKSQKMW
jgi:hypothetical protein